MTSSENTGEVVRYYNIYAKGARVAGWLNCPQPTRRLADDCMVSTVRPLYRAVMRWRCEEICDCKLHINFLTEPNPDAMIVKPCSIYRSLVNGLYYFEISMKETSMYFEVKPRGTGGKSFTLDVDATIQAQLAAG